MPIAQMLFSAQGRIRRTDYWLWSIITTIGAVFICGLLFFGVMAAYGDKKPDDNVLMAMAAVIAVVIAIHFWIRICLAAKRWHDRDKSGWLGILVILQYVLPVVNLVILIWQFIECGCLDGTQGPNQYGPSPKGIRILPNVF